MPATLKVRKHEHLLFHASENPDHPSLKHIHIVQAHNDVVRVHGHVYYGKVGKGMAKKRMEAINQNISEGITTYFYLMLRRGKTTWYYYKAKLLGIHVKCPDFQITSTYYAQERKNCSRWLDIEELIPIQEEELHSKFLSKNHANLSQLLDKVKKGDNQSPFLYITDN